jgi:GH43 family beta-xylosidase
MHILILLSAGLVAAFSAAAADTADTAETAAVVCSFDNPILGVGQDPSAVYHDGLYYIVQSNTTATGIVLYATPTLTDLEGVQPQPIYTAPPNTPYSRNLWAPELVLIDGAWVIYYAADDGDNRNHRTYVLRADTPDPLGPWSFAGPLFTDPALDRWAIDLNVFEHDDRLYAAWSGWVGDERHEGFHPQYLFVAAMADPLTIVGDRVEILAPTEPYERSVAAIIEGPQIYQHDGTTTIVYSADASWTARYRLAGVVLRGDDPLDPAAWERLGVLFEGFASPTGAPEDGVFGVGHNSNPIPSPDGSETWHLYHAKTLPTDGWADRHLRAQPFTWNDDGTPRFGQPLPVETTQPVPSGDPCGLTGEYDFAGETLAAPFDTGGPLVNTEGSYTVSAEVLMTDLNADAAIATQEGGIFSSFTLLYSAEAGSFAVQVTDMRGQPAAEAVARIPVAADTWYGVTAVADRLTDTVTLYIDGREAASAPLPAGWRSAGAFVIGATKARGQRTALFTGRLDDIFIFNGALSSTDARAFSTYQE